MTYSETDLRWLTGPEAADALAQSLQTDATTTPADHERLRRQFSRERAGLLLQQADLRRRAREKFGDDALRMFFTPVGLEQSTDRWTAEYKSRRFPQGEPLADLCCGIGGDLIALGSRGPATGVDRSLETAIFAEANAHALGLPNAKVLAQNVVEVDIGDFAAWHIDPDRRPSGRRTTQPDLYEPSLETLESLLETNADAAVKLAPAAVLPESWRCECELEWVSRDRQCRQLIAWRGVLAEHPCEHAATVLRGGTAHTITGEPDLPLQQAKRLGRYLYEPDVAVLAAHLTGEIAQRHALDAPNPAIPYLTSDSTVDDASLARFEVLEQLPFDRKRLRRLLADRRIGRLEIKKRGLELSPEKLRKELKLKGDNAAALLVFPCEGRTIAVLAARKLKTEN